VVGVGIVRVGLVVSALLVMTLLGAGCATPGSSDPPTFAPASTVPGPTATPRISSKSCLPAAEASFKRAERGPVRIASRSRSPEVLTCRYRATSPRPHVCRSVSVTVNTEAQPITDFNRWWVEASQEVTQGGRHAADLRPQLVSGVGLLADWVPALHELEAANQHRWVTVIVHACPAHTLVLAQARRVIRVAMRARVG
jgi:hypothetical protein